MTESAKAVSTWRCRASRCPNIELFYELPKRYKSVYVPFCTHGAMRRVGEDVGEDTQDR